mgnify:CR=1 FL=1
MRLAIAILAGIGYILDLLRHLSNDRLDVNLIFATILIISTWSVLPLAITIICITLLIGVVGALINQD